MSAAAVTYALVGISLAAGATALVTAAAVLVVSRTDTTRARVAAQLMVARERQLREDGEPMHPGAQAYLEGTSLDALARLPGLRQELLELRRQRSAEPPPEATPAT